MSWVHQSWLSEEIALVDGLPQGEEVEVLASSKTCAVRHIRPLEGPDLVVKHYFFPTWKSRLKGARRHTYWGVPKPVREAENLQRLAACSIPTLLPLMCGVRRQFGFVKDSWLVIPWIPDSTDLQRVVESGGSLPLLFWQNLGVSIRIMHEQGCFYRGLCARNVLIQGDHFYWVDAVKAKWSMRKWRASTSAMDLLIFLSPLRKHISQKEEEAFARGYGEGLSVDPHRLWARVRPWRKRWLKRAIAQELSRWHSQ